MSRTIADKLFALELAAAEEGMYTQARKLYNKFFMDFDPAISVDDIVQEACCYVWERRNRVPEHGNICAWLCVMVRYAFYSNVLNKKRKARVALDEIQNQEGRTYYDTIEAGNEQERQDRWRESKDRWANKRRKRQEISGARIIHVGLLSKEERAAWEREVAPCPQSS